MPSIGAIKRNSATLTLRFDTGDPDEPLLVQCVYQPRAIRPGTMRRLTDTDDPTNQMVGLAELAASMLVSWDLTEDDGVTPVPITRERFEDFDAELLNGIVNQLTAAQAPNAPSGTGSPATSGGSLA